MAGFWPGWRRHRIPFRDSAPGVVVRVWLIRVWVDWRVLIGAGCGGWFVG